MSPLFEEFSYGEQRQVDFFKRSLPPLPSKFPGNPSELYVPQKVLSLRRPPDKPGPPLKVAIRQAVDCYFGNFSQTCVATVVEGPQYWVGKPVFLKLYDPLFINPDDLRCTSRI